MKKMIFTVVLLSLMSNMNGQSRFSKQEFSINGFRNPSIGVEYRYHQVSVHAGYYTTAFKKGEYTNFYKAGVTYYYMPVGKKENPSSFYSSLSYAKGINGDYKDKDALINEFGFRWMVWKGLNLRLGVATLLAKGESVKVNPTPGISYSFFF
jgi:hypothetical protein